jgi:hypothetical protein
MVKNFEVLVTLCDEELRHREYLGSYYARLISYWEKIRAWLAEQNLTEFSEEVGNSIFPYINFLLKYEVYLNRIIFIILTRINAKSPLYSLYQT